MTEQKIPYKARGRKKIDKFDRLHLRIAATPEEREFIWRNLSTRERTTILIAAIVRRDNPDPLEARVDRFLDENLPQIESEDTNETAKLED